MNWKTNLDGFLGDATEAAMPIVTVGENDQGADYHGSTFGSIKNLAKELENDPKNPKKREEYFSRVGELYKKMLNLLPDEADRRRRGIPAADLEQDRRQGDREGGPVKAGGDLP